MMVDDNVSVDIYLSNTRVCETRSDFYLNTQDTVSELVPGASPRVKQCLRRRRNVWTRLGWKRFTHRISASKPRGFWSFRNKYRWRSRFTSTYRSEYLEVVVLKHLVQIKLGSPTTLGSGWLTATPSTSLNPPETPLEQFHPPVGSFLNKHIC